MTAKNSLECAGRTMSIGCPRRLWRILLGASALVFLPLQSVGASSEQGKEQTGATQAFSTEDRQRIEAFLNEEFHSYGVSPDLAKIVLRHVDAFASGRSLSEDDDLHPPPTTYPSVALQIQWQQSLAEIASDFRVKFRISTPNWSNVDLVLKDEPVHIPSSRAVYAFAADNITRAQGKLSENILKRPIAHLENFKGTLSEPVRQIGKFKKPI